jgi:hypothetical protein
MSWDEKRKGGPRYYYRSQRTDRGTVKQYFGRGPRGERQARLDEQRRQQRQAQLEDFLDEMRRVAPAEDMLREIRYFTNLLVRAMLLLNGYHQHKGQWRKWRRGHGPIRDGGDGT